MGLRCDCGPTGAAAPELGATAASSSQPRSSQRAPHLGAPPGPSPWARPRGSSGHARHAFRQVCLQVLTGPPCFGCARPSPRQWPRPSEPPPFLPMCRVLARTCRRRRCGRCVVADLPEPLSRRQACAGSDQGSRVAVPRPTVLVPVARNVAASLFTTTPRAPPPFILAPAAAKARCKRAAVAVIVPPLPGPRVRLRSAPSWGS